MSDITSDKNEQIDDFDLQKDEQVKDELTKEEILEKYREENINGDERTQKEKINAGNIAFMVGLWIAVIMNLIYRILGRDIPYEVDLIWFTMWSVNNFLCYAKQKRAGLLFCGIVGAVGALVSLGLIIYSLLGAAA